MGKTSDVIAGGPIWAKQSLTFQRMTPG